MKPAYSSVQRSVPTPVVTEWPASLKEYVKKVNESCPPAKKALVEDMLRNLIKDVQSKGAIWSTDWNKMPIPKECLSWAQVAKKKVAPPMPQIPVFRPAMPKVAPPSNSIGFIPIKSYRSSNQITPIPPQPIVQTAQIPQIHQIKQFDIDQFNMEQIRKNQKKSKVMAVLEESDDLKLSRLKRFSEKQEVESRKKKKALSHAQKVREAFIAAGAEGNPDVIDWDEDTVVGTCRNLEKNYLRITSAVDPTTVRPLRILIQSLDFLIKKWKSEGNYTYICDQLKSVRQDLTVQRIKNEFTVKVYETHARIAIEKGDLGEFNQCQGQLKDLYQIYKLPGNIDEFMGYRILYMIHTNNKTELVQTIANLSDAQKSLPCVSHSLQVRSSIATRNYDSLFNLYISAPCLSGYLMDQFIDRERIKALVIISHSFRPTFPLQDLNLGFMNVSELKKWLLSHSLAITGDLMDTKASFPTLSSLYSTLSAKAIDIKGQIH